VLEIISALRFRELIEDAAAETPEFVDGPFRAVAEQLLELRKRQFDGIQVRRVWGQIAQLGADRFDGFPNSSNLVAGEIIHHHNVARFQGGRQMLLYPSAEQRPVDGPFDRERSDEPFRAQRAQKSRRLPTSARGFLHHARAQFRAAVTPRHVGFRPRFVDENDFGGIDSLL